MAILMEEFNKISEENLPEKPSGAKTVNWKREVWDWAKSLLWAVLIVAVVFGFIIKPVEVKGFSMEPTLNNQDRLIVYKLMYTPKAGDVVILDESTGLDEELVKRVIATEGQTVSIDDQGYVKVDGVYIDEPYIAEPIAEDRRGDHEYPVEVPDGCVFVMGDNRNHSTDSRSLQVSFVPIDDVVGKVVFRILPLNKIGVIH